MTHPIAELRADLLGRIERAAAEAELSPCAEGDHLHWHFQGIVDDEFPLTPTTIARMVRIVRAAIDVRTSWFDGSLYMTESSEEEALLAALAAFDDLEAERAKEADR